MIAADTDYEVSAIKFFMTQYGVNPGKYIVVFKRKSGMNQTDGLTVPAGADKFVVFISDKASGAELIRLIAHETAHVCQIIKGDLAFKTVDGSVKVYWHGKEFNPDKMPYRTRPWEIEAFTLEKKYVHDFIKRFGNQMNESSSGLDFNRMNYSFMTTLNDGVYDAIQSGYTVTINGIPHKTKSGIRGTIKTKAIISNGTGNLINYIKTESSNMYVEESKQIKAGDTIKIKKEWQDVGDDKITWIAVNDEEKGRVLIRNKYDKQPIPQTHLVQVSMLEGINMKTFEQFMTEVSMDKYEAGETSFAVPVEQMNTVVDKLGAQWFTTWKAMQKASSHDKDVSKVVKEYESVMKAFVNLSNELEHFNHDLLNTIDP